MRGYIYILKHESGNTVKVGCTTRDPNIRGNEYIKKYNLKRHDLYKEFPVDLQLMKKTEAEVHLILKKYLISGIANARELFACSPEIAENAVEKASAKINLTNGEKKMTKVKKVKNAESPLVIRLTQQDYQTGVVKDHNFCMVAKAVKREHNTEADVSVTRILIRDRHDKELWYRYQTPNDLREEIKSFDRQGTINPGEYTLRAVPQWMARAVTKKTGKTTKAPVKAKRRSPIRARNIRARPGPSIHI